MADKSIVKYKPIKYILYGIAAGGIIQGIAISYRVYDMIAGLIPSFLKN
ncbi:MAG: hypothetical protein ACTSRK_18300 [Promethearchaeota archaeon]